MLEDEADGPGLRAWSAYVTSWCIVRMITLAREPAAVSQRAASIPLSEGIVMSATMTSGRSVSAASMVGPSTIPTRSKWGVSQPRSPSATMRWSSAAGREACSSLTPE